MVVTRTQGLSYQEELLEKANTYLPGGALSILALPPEVAFVVDRAQGSKLWDVAGKEYIDYALASGPLILGHAHPAIVRAIHEQVGKGTTYYFLNEPAILLAEKVVQAVPCAETIKFTSTGSEATLNALRIARAYTGRQKILKFEGGYHGVHDYALQSANNTRLVDFPAPVPDSAGIPAAIGEDILVAPFNNAEMAVDLIEKHATEIAAVIVEPLLRVIPPRPGFLGALRQVTRDKGIVLIFDEVVTGFRLAWGGAQERFGVVPDLAALGKAIAAGFPLAAVCGRREIMAVVDAKRRAKPDWVYFGGTLNGNPLVTAAGLATLTELEKPGTYERLRAGGEKLAAGLRKLGAEMGIPLKVVGDGPVFQPFFTDKEIVDHRSTLLADKKMGSQFGVELLKRGIANTPGGKFFVSTAHSEEDLDRTLEAFEAALKAIKA